MNFLHSFLAQAVLPTDMIPGSWHWMGFTLKELLELLGALTGVTLLIVIWAVYFRPRPHRHSHHHHHHHHSQSEASSSDLTSNSGSGSSGERRYRRKRRRRRDHRPRNPTLAETGGLPPLRPEHPQDPLP
jgi:hypothetical protein